MEASFNRSRLATITVIFHLAILAFGASSLPAQFASQRQITKAAQGHMLTNVGVWSPDSKWIVYDTRTSLDGSVFNGQTIERVYVETGQIERLYQSRDGACCGVVTYHPKLDQVVFILGPERPTADWQYGPARRQGVIVDCKKPGIAVNLDARDLVPPFTSGALRGGTHVHTFSTDGRIVASTYEDAVLDMAEATRLSSQEATPKADTQTSERNLRGIALSLTDHPVKVPSGHPRNQSGSAFTVLATDLSDHPGHGSDQIVRACEEGWIGIDGYLRDDGTRQSYAVAFQGTVISKSGSQTIELFVLDIDRDLSNLTQAGSGALVGTPTTRPKPPRGVRQRRITFTENRKYPGIVTAPRHWLRSTPDGSSVAFLAKDDQGIVQIFAVSPNGGAIRQVTNDAFGVASSFSFSPDGNQIAYMADNSLFVVDFASGVTTRLTKTDSQNPPRPEAVVFSPNGRMIAFLRTMPTGELACNQIHVVEL